MTKHSIDGQRLFARPRDLRPVGRDGEGRPVPFAVPDAVKAGRGIAPDR